jgi:hypothetical protein
MPSILIISRKNNMLLALADDASSKNPWNLALWWLENKVLDFLKNKYIFNLFFTLNT